MIRASTLATSVLPTPASPSRKSGLPRCCARKMVVAISRSAKYCSPASLSCTSSIDSNFFIIKGKDCGAAGPVAYCLLPVASFPADPLDENIHDAAADLVFTINRGRQVDAHDLGAAALQYLHRLLPDLGLTAAAADRAEERPVRPHDHLGAGLARRRATRAGNRGERKRLAGFKTFGDLRVDLVAHPKPHSEARPPPSREAFATIGLSHAQNMLPCHCYCSVSGGSAVA